LFFSDQTPRLGNACFSNPGSTEFRNASLITPDSPSSHSPVVAVGVTHPVTLPPFSLQPEVWFGEAGSGVRCQVSIL
jgi:hypothetical protein